MNTKLPAYTPQEAITQAIDAICAGDIDTSIAGYEPTASFVGAEGEVASGHEAVRDAIAPFAALRPDFTMDIERVVEAGEIALVCGRWSLSATDPDGKPIRMSGRNVDVVRRQPDGSWLLVIDNPFFADQFARDGHEMGNDRQD